MADITVNNKYTSGTFGTTNNYVKFAVEITELSYNIENNTSQVKVRVYAWRSNSGYTTYGTGTCYVTIAGTQYSQSISSSQTITYNSNTEIFSKTLTVSHADDGTLNLTTATSWSINAQGSGSYNYTGTTSAVSFNRALTTIPRASDITCTSPVDMGTSQSVTITQKSASFSHVLYYSTDGGTTWTELGRNTATHTYSWSVPDTSNSLPNADNATYTLKCETYLNGTYSDTPLESTAAIVANVPAAYVPTITIGSITEGNANVPAGFPFIVGHSKPTIPTTFTGSHNSTVASRTITLNGETLTSTATVEPVSLTATRALSATTTAVTATATDSRGRQGTDTTNITAQAYNSPSVEIDCTRCLSDGTIDPLGTYVLVLAKWSWTSVTNGGGELNSADIVLKKNGTTVSTYSTATNTQTTLTQIAILSGFNNTDQYTVTAEISDLLVSSTVSQLVTKAQMPLSLYDDGTDIGVTVGRMATQGGLNNWLDLGLVSGKNVNLYDNNSQQIGQNEVDCLLFDASTGVNKTNTTITYNTNSADPLTTCEVSFTYGADCIGTNTYTLTHNSTTYNYNFVTEMNNGGGVGMGTFDVLTGELNLGYVYYEITGSTCVSCSFEGSNLCRINAPSLKYGTNNYYKLGFADRYTVVDTYAQVNGHSGTMAFNGNGGSFLLCDDNITTYAELVTSLNANPIHIIYPLSATYQLTAQPISSAVGNNTFTATTATHIVAGTTGVFARADGNAVPFKTINGSSILGSGDLTVGGGIYDSGSNTNGNWIRYNDGTMMCWQSVSVTNQAINTAYTSGHYTGNRTFTFPQPFTDRPVVNCSTFRWGTSASWPVMCLPSNDFTQVTIYAMDIVSRSSGTNTRIEYTAVGKWQ